MKKEYTMKYAKQYCKTHSVDEFEAQALRQLERNYRGDWNKAEIIVDVIDNKVVFSCDERI